MATGYGNREAAASPGYRPTAARATQTSARAVQIGRSGVSGAGEATGGVRRSENPSLGMGVGASIPGFLEEIFEPAIAKQSAERMYQGYADAVDGQTMQEIGAAQPALAGLFGQTDFEKGASFYHAQNGLQQWQAEQMQNMDALKRLPPDQVGKVLFDGASKFLTGDTETDNAIHRMVIEQSYTLLPQVTTARIQWRNSEGIRLMTEGAVGAGGILNTMMTQAKEGTAPLDPTAYSNARLAVAQAMIKPEGMPEESWSTAVDQTARNFLADGNIAAFNVMKEGGNESLLFHALGAHGDATKYQALLNLAEGVGKDANTEYATRPETSAAIDLMWAQVETGELRGNALRAKMEEFNKSAATWTGSDEPLFDAETIRTGVRGTVRDVVQEDRANARAELEWSRSDNNPANALAKAERESTDIRNLIAKGQSVEAELRYPGKVDATMRAWYLAEPVPAVRELVRNHQQQGQTFPGVATDIQSKVSANITAGGNSAAFQQANEQWKAFAAADGNGSAARAFYYGDYDALFDRFNQLSGSGGIDPLTAYQQTFGQAGAIAGTQTRLPRAQGTLGTAVEAAVQGMRPGWIGRALGGTGPNRSSQQVILDVVSGAVEARVRANPSQANNIAGLVAAEVEVARSSRKLDSVGERYWNTPLRGPSLTTATGIGPAQLAPLWEAEVKDQFERTYRQVPTDYDVAVGTDGAGNPMWSAYSTDSEGQTRIIRITPNDLRRRRTEDAGRARLLQSTAVPFGLGN